MTRWARSSSALKHARQPEEATSWNEFRAQRQRARVQSQAKALSAQGQRGIYRTVSDCTYAGGVKLEASGDAESVFVPVRTEEGDRLHMSVEAQKDELQEDTLCEQAGDMTEWKHMENVKLEKHSHISDSKVTSSSLEGRRSRKLSGNSRKVMSGIKREAQSDEVPVNKVNCETVSKNVSVKSEKVKKKTLTRKLKEISGATSGWIVTEICDKPQKVKRTEKKEKEHVEEEKEEKQEQRMYTKENDKHKWRMDKKENDKQKGKNYTQENDYKTSNTANGSAKNRDHKMNSTVNDSATKSVLKKKRFINQLRKERESKGIILLPEKVEKRIYAMKKAMRQKGVSGEEIKAAVRKVRRKEELLFRRQLEKSCFKCRQPGHKVSDCPKMEAEIDEAVGICFKCGSTEHFSSKCLVQTSLENEFPYAKCFICNQGGHLSRKCPQNEKGVYPKGGHCNFCGAIDHFKKDCPQMERNKKKDDEPEIMGDMMDIHGSADAEPVTPDMLTKQRKSKIVTF